MKKCNCPCQITLKCRQCDGKITDEPWELSGILRGHFSSLLHPLCLIGPKSMMTEIVLHKECVPSYLKYIADNFSGDLCREQPVCAVIAGVLKEVGRHEPLRPSHNALNVKVTFARTIMCGLMSITVRSALRN